jgi:hypothetical protein
MTAIQWRILYFLAGGLALAVGTPAYLGLSHRDLSVYLLHPMIFGCQILPYAVGAALWLPWRSPAISAIGQILAGILFLSSALLYLPLLTGLTHLSGDMIGLSFILVAIVTTSAVVLVTVAAFGFHWFRRQAPRT